MKLQHEFEVPASPAETLALLLDPERVVPCMPGATLVEIVDDATWKTTMAVKLGPMGMDFLNDVRVVEHDGDEGHARLAVKGRDTRGKGGADATVDATLLATDGGGTRVTLDSDVRFSGQAAQLGRPSVIGDVSTRLVDQFARCVAAQLDSPPEQAEAARAEARKPLPGISLLLAALRGSLARLFRSRSGPREGGTT